MGLIEINRLFQFVRNRLFSVQYLKILTLKVLAFGQFFVEVLLGMAKEECRSLGFLA